MARFLKQVLQNDHPLFLMNIARLERATGNAGVDTRLIADITEKAHAVMRRMGLDPADTTATELYAALNSLVTRKDTDEMAVLKSVPFVLIDLGSGPVSFNLHDVIENAHHNLPFEQRSLAHAQRKLRAEVVRRYANHERTHDEFVGQLAKEIELINEEDETHPDISSMLPGEMGAPAENAPYLLAIGDIFTDAFIKLNEDEAKITTDDEGKKWLSVEFGAKMPYDHVDEVRSVGPSPNAAVSFARLGSEKRTYGVFG